MIVYQTNMDGTLVGAVELNDTDKCPITGNWLIPGGCVETTPPAFDAEKQTCTWTNGVWVVADIPVEPGPVPTEPEIVTPVVDQDTADMWEAILTLSAKLDAMEGK